MAKAEPMWTIFLIIFNKPLPSAKFPANLNFPCGKEAVVFVCLYLNISKGFMKEFYKPRGLGPFSPSYDV